MIGFVTSENIRVILHHPFVVFVKNAGRGHWLAQFVHPTLYLPPH
jgi:hypothetical protein